MGQKLRLSPSRSALPTTTAARLRRRTPLKKTLKNIYVTVSCFLITVLVLRGSFGPIAGSSPPVPPAAEDIDRILRDILSDPDDPISGSTANYTLGPKISNWDAHRRRWLADNPAFAGAPRILLVTGSPPTPCDNPIGDHYLLKSTKNKIDYCRLHRIELIHSTATLDDAGELAGYWSKLPLIRRLMLAHPELDWIWWLDSDAIITDMEFTLPLRSYDSHHLVVHGYPDLLDQRSWIALNTGSFLLRNSQWSLDLLDAWAPMGPKGPIRDNAGRLLTAFLNGRPEFEADDQSALIYLLISQKHRWADKVYIENSYYLHGFWDGLVDRYEEMMEKHHPGLGDERWPFVTHFVGCKPCGSYGDYPVERCIGSMERAFNFADNQVLRLYGFAHTGLSSSKIKRIRNETSKPLEAREQLGLHDGGSSRR